jgi:hypothetical protein
LKKNKQDRKENTQNINLKLPATAFLGVEIFHSVELLFCDLRSPNGFGVQIAQELILAQKEHFFELCINSLLNLLENH